MKKHFSFLVWLGLGLAACQPQSGGNTTALPTATALPTSPAPVAANAVTHSPADSTVGVLSLLRSLDLAPLWTRTNNGQPAKSAMDGFYGADHYHIAFYFDSVKRDKSQPARYYVWGRNRYKHITTPFEGVCTVTRLAALPDTVSMKDSRLVNSYTAFATFVLREDPTTKGAGTYTGRAYLDFCLPPSGKPKECEFMDMDAGSGNPTQGSGLVFRGQWRSNATGLTKPVAWASWYGVVVPDALRKLGLGERGEEVNPKLAKYGWGEKWENDEWWASSPKPTLL